MIAAAAARAMGGVDSMRELDQVRCQMYHFGSSITSEDYTEFVGGKTLYCLSVCHWVVGPQVTLYWWKVPP